MGQVIQLGQHERRALVVRQVVEIPEQLLQVGTLSHLVLQPRGENPHFLDWMLPAGAQQGQAPVAGNGVQPSP